MNKNKCIVCKAELTLIHGSCADTYVVGCEYHGDTDRRIQCIQAELSQLKTTNSAIQSELESAKTTIKDTMHTLIQCRTLLRCLGNKPEFVEYAPSIDMIIDYADSVWKPLMNVENSN